MRSSLARIVAGGGVSAVIGEGHVLRPATGWMGVALLSAAVVAGCHPGYCVEGIEIGKSYRVTVLEPADSNSQYAVQTERGPDFGMPVGDGYTCGPGVDFVAGASFVVTPYEIDGRSSCNSRYVRLSGLDSPQLVREVGQQLTMATGNIMLAPRYEATVAGGCTVSWDLGFDSPRRAPPLTVPTVGEYPPVLMGRWIARRGAGSPASCFPASTWLPRYNQCLDFFVVKLEAL